MLIHALIQSRRALMVMVICATVASGSARADCPPLHDSLSDADSVVVNGGEITGTVSFAPAVNGNGAHFAGNGSIRYTNDLFRSPRGSVSLWFRKLSSDASGGILQVGQLGQLNSMGLFYTNGNDLHFEMRNAGDSWAAIPAYGSLSQSESVHIVATWDDSDGGMLLKLFVNAQYVDYRWVSGTYYHVSQTMDIGIAGVGAWYGYAEGAIDELTVFDRPMLDSEIYAEYIYSSQRYARQTTPKPISTGNVQISGKRLLVNGLPFTVKGVGYQPVPIGYGISRATLDFTFTDPCILARDIPLLRQMNVNTVRFWSQLPDSDVLLDALYNSGVDPIYAIMGFWVPLYNGVDYTDPATTAAIESDLVDYVNRFKDHPAVLGWGLGNENNLAYNGDLADWYALANRLAEAAYNAEGSAYHPTIIINGGMLDFADTQLGSDDVSLNFVDIWGHNAYFGYEDHCYFEYFDKLSAKPVIVTEYGIDAFDNNAGSEYLNVQADWVVHQWQQMVGKCVGGTVMAYSDEWWKAGDPDNQDSGGYYTDLHADGFSNEEWWGMVSVSSSGGSCDTVTPRPVFYALGAEYGKPDIATGDFDGDGDVDLDDYGMLESCFTGPDAGPIDPKCTQGDLDGDADIDCDDWDLFLSAWSGPGVPKPLEACAATIPTVSQWGLVMMMLLLCAGGTIVLRSRRGSAVC